MPRIDVRTAALWRREQLSRAWHVIRTFAPYAKRHRALALGAFASIVAGAGIRVLQPLPLKYLFDDVLIPSADTIARSEPVAFPARTIALICVAILAAGVAAGFAFYGERVLAARAGQAIVSSIRRSLFGHVLRLPLSDFRTLKRGEILNLLGRDVEHLRELLVNVILDVAGSVVHVVTMLTIMFLLNPRLSLVALAILPLVGLASVEVSFTMRDVARKQRRRESLLLSSAQNVLDAMPIVKIFGRERSERRRFARDNRATRRAGVKLKRLEAALVRRVEVLLALATCVFIFVGVREVWLGELSAGGLLLFASYLKSFQKPIRRLTRSAAKLSRATTCGERVAEAFARPIELDTEGPEVEECARSLSGEVTFEDVSLRYPDGTVALRDVSFHVPAGSVVALIGPSGAGKSTLVSLITRLIDPTSGIVRYDGQDGTRIPRGVVRRHVTAVFQESYLFDGTIAENLRYGREDADDADLREHAVRANAWSFVEARGDVLEAPVGDFGRQFSGGERQRLTVARALLRNAPIVLLDEPTRGLDDVSAAAVRRALVDYGRGRTVFWATHDPEEVSHADLTLVVTEGRARLHRGAPQAALGEVPAS